MLALLTHLLTLRLALAYPNVLPKYQQEIVRPLPGTETGDNLHFSSTMYLQNSLIPRISISPPPPEDPVFEPYSPFKAIVFPSVQDDGFRPVHLTPPPTLTRFKKPFERVEPVTEDKLKRGLESERFQALLKATKERNAAADAKKVVSLRKELALKVHKNKQGLSLTRRMLCIPFH